MNPKRVHDIIGKHGDDVVFHMKKPILREYPNSEKLVRNLLAFKEIIEIARERKDFDAEIVRERRSTANYRAYRTEYGDE